MSTVTVEDRRRAGQARSRWRLAPAHAALIAVAVLYGVAVVLRTSQTTMPEWDEIVYASQAARDVPPVPMSAPRARGMPWLLAPVTSVTTSILAMRVYLTVLSGIMMYVAFRPWVAVFRGREGWQPYVPAAAAGLFATLWITLLYGTMAYPNLWVAFTVIAGVGLYCLAMAGHRRKALVVAGILAAFTAASLFRPVDAAAAAFPLLLAPLVVRSWRRAAPVVAVAAGLAVGWGEWLYEAVERYGGPLQRLRAAADINAGGLTWSLSKHLDSLSGPHLLCRPPEVCADTPLWSILWVLALPVLVAAGLVAARRSGLFRVDMLATACALSLTAPYLLLFGYAAPRFLLTAYGLVALPVAHGLVRVLRQRTPEARLVATYAVLTLVAAHVLSQQTVLERVNDHLAGITTTLTAKAESLRETDRVHPPCLIVGRNALQYGYLLGCEVVAYAGGPDPVVEERITGALADGYDVAVVLRSGDAVLPVMAGWERVPLAGVGRHVAYLSP